ncbi:PssE/Cps14G family polysaccharide biosynthesis glycosyltransferase [Vibrio breoganii]
MLNILVTTGTTRFPELITSVSTIASRSDYQFVVQSPDIKTLVSQNSFSFGTVFDYSDNFQKYIDEADIVITHAGAGTTYGLLESFDRPIIIVPNFYRSDQHQKEIAKYVEVNNFALVCWDLSKLGVLIEKCQKGYKKVDYKKVNFSKFSEILGYIR